MKVHAGSIVEVRVTEGLWMVERGTAWVVDGREGHSMGIADGREGHSMGIADGREGHSMGIVDGREGHSMGSRW